jgi:uncharacterized protein (TIGR03435 family)
MLIAALLVLGCGNLYAQSVPADRFEVVSIRRSGTTGGRPSMEFPPGGVRASNVTLKLLIQIAYDVRQEQVSGGAGWTDSEEYTVIAKGAEAPMEVTRKRLQALLKDRFQLALKVESHSAAGFALTVAKGGHKMMRATEAETRQMRQVGRWEVRAERVEMSLLARFLGVHLRATVVDKTGLDGAYDFHLNWTPAEKAPTGFDAPEESLIPAVEEQLGLKLERQKVATERYTIERAEKATEN